MKVGESCYILLNNCKVEEAVIKSVSGNQYTLVLKNMNKAIRLPRHRLFDTEEGAVGSKNETKDIDNKWWNFKPPMLH